MLQRCFPRNSDWLSKASAALSAVFIVLCLFSIEDSEFGILRSKQGRQLSELGSSSIAPDNLPLAGEILRMKLSIPGHDVPGETLSQGLAWTTFRGTLAAYAERLKVLDRQSEELDHCLQRRSLWTSFAALGVILSNFGLLFFIRRNKTVPAQ